MKKNIIILIAGAFVLAFAISSCDHNLSIPIEFGVSLDGDNTYQAGESVRFNFSGNAQNIVFYSGEQGHMYEYKDRYEYEAKDILSIDLTLNYYAYYDELQTSDDPTQMDAWLCKDFEGLYGDNFDADSLMMATLYNNGMPGWEKLEYVDDPSQLKIYVPYTYHLDKEYINSFVLAFHFKPREVYPASTSWRRFYRVSGLVSTEVANAAPVTLSLLAMNWQSITFNTTEAARYSYVNNTAGVRIMTGNSMYAILWDARKYGSASKVPPEGWCISRPATMTKANPDTGETIKNLQNDASSYEYAYSQPGSYKATFIAINRSISGGSEIKKEIEFTIK